MCFIVGVGVTRLITWLLFLKIALLIVGDESTHFLRICGSLLQMVSLITGDGVAHC